MEKPTRYVVNMSNPDEIGGGEMDLESMPLEMMAKFATGELNAQAWMQAHMINCGQGVHEWVGFEKAREEWNEFNEKAGLIQKENCEGDKWKIPKH